MIRLCLIVSRNHAYFNRRAKPCVKCGINESMPSASYCKECHREYDKERKHRIKKILSDEKKNEEPESGIVLTVINGAFTDEP